MVAIVTGNGLGLQKSSASVLGARGQMGAAGLGRANDGVTVNAANGNLVIGNRDEFVVGKGIDVSISRTYNSLGQFTDDNGDNWRLSNQRKVTGLTGTANTAGSTFTLVDWDGSELVYSWDASKGTYVNKDGDGGYRTGYLAGQYWILKNGSNTLEEQYDNANGGRLIWVTDQDRAIWQTYSYDGSGKLSTIATGDGSSTTLTWSGNNLQSLTTTTTDVQTGVSKTLTRTRYTYDGYNRLATVTTDLSPDDNSIADGRVYTTTYSYVGASKLVASIAQTDGSLLSFSYDGANRVSSFTQTVENGIARTTTFAYGAGYTSITDALSNVTTMYFDGAGQLYQLVEPAAIAGGAGLTTGYSYNGNGDVTYTSLYEGGAFISNAYYRYDANGNLFDTYTTTDKGYEVVRFYYGAQNQLLSSTSYTGYDTDGHGGVDPTGGMTTRFVYDSELHLRFKISAEGQVTEYRYNAPGHLVSEIAYAVGNVGTGGLPETFNWSEADLVNWLTYGPDKSASQRTDTSYDFRGNLQEVTRYAKTDSVGNGILAGGFTRDIYVYDQYGNLLSKQAATGEPVVSHTNLATEWYSGGLNPSAAGNAANGQPATQYTVQTTGGWSAFYNGYYVSDGDTVTTSITLKGIGTSPSASIGMYGSQTAWGANQYSVARIISGPGVISQEVGGLWNITGLSNTEETKIEITRNYAQGDTSGGVYVYADRPSGWRAGQGVIASSPVVVKTRDATETYAYDGMGRAIRFTDAKGVGTWTTYMDAQSRTVVTLASGLTQTSSYNKAGEMVAFAEARATPTSVVADFAQWNLSQISGTAAGIVDGAPATKLTINAGQTYGAATSYLPVVAGDTITYSISLQALGAATTQYLGIYGDGTGWNQDQTGVTSARVISGGGKINSYYGGLWQVTGLSATESTRIEITRTFTQAEGAYIYTYVYGETSSPGQGMIVSGANVTKTRYDGLTAAVVTAAEAKTNIADPAQWSSYYISRTASGTTLNYAPATKFTVDPGQTYGAAYSYTAANAGDVLTFTVTLQAIGGNTTQMFGIHGGTSGWGDSGVASFRIVSGPGELAPYGNYGGLSYITGLSTTAPTRVEVTRTFTQAEGAYAYVYALSATSSPGDVSLVSSAALTRSKGDLTDYRYDSLGRLRIKIDPAGVKTFYFYDKRGRKIADVAGDGAVTEYKYDAADRVVASVQYATALTTAQMASFHDPYYINPTAVEFASVRPGTTANDRWNWNIYDKVGRAIETIDAYGSAVGFEYDGAGRITRKTAFANQIAAATVETFKTTPPVSANLPAAYLGLDRVTRYFYDNDSRLVGTLDPENYLTEQVYDKAGRQIESISYYGQPATTYLASGTFAQLKSTQPSHALDAHSYTLYDGRGFIGATIDAEGNLTRFSYDARGNVSRQERGQVVAANTAYTLATLPASSGTLQVTTMVRDLRGQVSSQTQLLAAGNLTSTFAYDAVGNLISAIDARGYQSYKYYDAKGRLVREEVPLDIGVSTWAVTRYEYDSRGNVIKVIDPRGNASYNYYDERSRLVLAIDAEGYATEKSYTVTGDVAWVRRYYAKPSGTGNAAVRPNLIGDAKDATTYFFYDLRSLVIGTTDAEGKSENFYYNAFGEKYYSVNKLGGSESFYYTRRGQLYYSYTNEEVRRNDGSVQLAYRYKNLYEYDARGNVSRMVEGYALTERRDTIYSYDRNSRLVQKYSTAVSVLNINTGVETSVNPTENYKYDARGNLIEVADPNIGSRTLYYYDEAGRKVAEVNAVGTHKTYSYDQNGNLTVERVYGNATALPGTAGGAAPAPSGTPREVYFAYDRANRLIEKRILGVQKGELVGTVYQRPTSDIVTSIGYDFMGNVSQEIDGRGSSIFHYYDKNGREIAKADQENYITAWTRDSEGNVLSETRFATQYGATPIIGTIPTVAANGADRTTTFTYDKMGRRLTETRLAVSASTVSGNAVATSAQNATITYTYNNFGEVLSKTEASGDRTDYVYDTYGRMTSRREAAFVNNAGAAVRLTTDLYYDGLNNLVYERPSELNSGADARANRYTYGAGGRLASMSDTNGFTRNYKYDAAGRVVEERYTRTKSNGATVTDAKYSTYDTVGRVTSQFLATYDGAWTYMPTATTTYNAYGDVATRGVAGSATEQMFYDNAGRVVKSSAGDGVWKFFVYDANGNVTLTLTNTAIADLGHWTQNDAIYYSVGGGNNDLANFSQYYNTATVAVYDRRNSAVETYEPNRTIAAADVATTTTQTLNTRRWMNAFGEVTQEKSARGFYTNYAYNTMGKVIQVQAPEITVTFENGSTARQRPTENYAYDLSGRLVGTQNANGFWTTRLLLAGTGYGEQEAAVTTEYRADGTSVGYGYDVYGNQKWARDGLNRYTYNNYDNANRLIVTTRPSGNYELYGYNELGQRTSHTNNVFGTTIKETTDYDAQGRVTSSRNYAGDVTNYAYSWNGALATNGLGTFGGWTKTTTRPDYLTSSETTDVFGRMTNRTDLGGRVYTYNYNEAGQLASQSSTAGQNISYSYFNTGRVATMLDNAGVAYGYSTSNIDAAYTYDADGNRTYERLAGTTTYYDPYSGYASGTGVTTVYQEGKGSYDEKGNLLTFTDAGASGNGAVSITNAYDAAGNVRRTLATHATLASNQTLSGTITDDYWYKYDALNRMTMVKGSLVNGAIIRGTVEAREVTYNAAGERATQARTVTGFTAYTNWAQESREIYTYTADGYVAQLNIATGAQVSAATGQPAPFASVTAATGAGVVRSTTSYDGLGRVTGSTEYDTAGTAVYSRYSIGYDYRNNVTTDNSWLRRYESDGYLYVSYASTTNTFGAGGLLTFSSTVNYRYKNGTTYNDTPDTSNSYSYVNWDAPMQASVTFRPNTSQATTYTTTYSYDLNGHLTLAQINDGRARNVTYVNDASGQILTRTEADNIAYNATTGAGGDPKTVWWFFDGKQVGSTGNNGNDDPDFETALNERTQQPGTATNAAFRLGATTGSSFSDFDQAYNSLSPGEGGSAGSSYTVRGGDTLSSIAQSVYGDSALWYMIADANGLRGGAQLTAGQSINIPAKLANFNNRSDTFRPYDSARSIGDTQPTTPAPPKKPKCGIFGMILLAAISAAIVAIAPFGGGFLGSIANAVLGSAVSQGVGVATGIQEKFSFKALAMAAVGAAVGGALGKFNAFGEKGLGTLTKFGNDFARGALGNVITQGVGVATGLQKKFDFAGIATAGVAAGVGGVLSRTFDLKSMSAQTTKNANGTTTRVDGNLKFDNIVGHAITGAAKAIASAATRSVIEGSDFGDNVLATLPDAIGSTIGEALGGLVEGKLHNAAERRRSDAREGEQARSAYYEEMRGQSSGVPGAVTPVTRRLFPTPSEPYVVDDSKAIVVGPDGDNDISLIGNYDPWTMRNAALNFDLDGALTIYSHGGPQIYQKTGQTLNARGQEINSTWAFLDENAAGRLILRAGGNEPIILLGCISARRGSLQPGEMPNSRDYIYRISSRVGGRPILAATSYVYTYPPNSSGTIVLKAWVPVAEYSSPGNPANHSASATPGRFLVHNGSLSAYGIHRRSGEFVQGFASNPTTGRSFVILSRVNSAGVVSDRWVPWNLGR
jgi:YD repeat-containing protein